MEPGYGVELVIDDLEISDQAVVHMNGDAAVAQVWRHDMVDEDGTLHEAGYERIARIVGVTETVDKRTHATVITGKNSETGAEQTWVIRPGKKGCRGCG